MEMIYNILVHPVLKTLGILFVGMSSFITVGTFWPLSGLEPVLIKLLYTLGYYYSILKKVELSQTALIYILHNCPFKAMR